MQNKKKMLALGAAALLVFGLVMAVNAVVNATKVMEKQGIDGFHRNGCMQGGFPRHMDNKFLEELGLPENASRKQVRDAVWDKQLKELGLTESSTIKEFRQALEARAQAMGEERIQKIKEKLNLPENATQEDIKNAMKQWRDENKGLLPGKGHRLEYGTHGLVRPDSEIQEPNS